MINILLQNYNDYVKISKKNRKINNIHITIMINNLKIKYRNIYIIIN